MVGREIKKANALYADYQEQILQNEDCARLLSDYRTAIENTMKTMKNLNIVEFCSSCSDKWIGGCCFMGVENWYDSILLLVNLIFGITIPKVGRLHDGCLFVGPTGCKLLARHSFCINYFCNTLKYSITPPDMKKLLYISGKEILLGIQVEQSIRKLIA